MHSSDDFVFIQFLANWKLSEVGRTLGTTVHALIWGNILPSIVSIAKVPFIIASIIVPVVSVEQIENHCATLEHISLHH